LLLAALGGGFEVSERGERSIFRSATFEEFPERSAPSIGISKNRV